MPMEKQGTVENQLAHTIDQTEYDSRYDRTAKKLLANKQILAQIMKGCVNEYSDCTVDDIVEKYIEGTPEVGSVGVHVDDTNRPKKSTDVIKGSNNEDSTLTEGTLFYDVRFDAIAPKSADSAEQEEVIRLIINVEAQTKFKPGWTKANKPTAGRTKAIHRRLELSFNLYLLLLFVGQNRASKSLLHITLRISRFLQFFNK